MWTPQIVFLNVFQTPTRQKAANSATFYVSKQGKITSYHRNAILTFSCGMEFSSFPFDVQVGLQFIMNFVNYISCIILFLYKLFNVSY